jgi:hypothetical protein
LLEFFPKEEPNGVLHSSSTSANGLFEAGKTFPKGDGPEDSVSNDLSLISQKRHRLPGRWERKVIGGEWLWAALGTWKGGTSKPCMDSCEEVDWSL